MSASPASSFRFVFVPGVRPNPTTKSSTRGDYIGSPETIALPNCAAWFVRPRLRFRNSSGFSERNVTQEMIDDGPHPEASQGGVSEIAVVN